MAYDTITVHNNRPDKTVLPQQYDTIGKTCATQQQQLYHRVVIFSKITF
jgi:hypothetical protein